MKRVFIYIIIAAAIVSVTIGFLLKVMPMRPVVAYGATFTPLFAEQLGLDWREAFRAMLDDLGIRNIRIAAYWDRTEPKRDVFNFSETDWMVREAKAHQVHIIFAIGQKLPRWPECHIPIWASKLPSAEYEKALLNYIKNTIAQYESSNSIQAWQIENEPFLSFGECPPFSTNLLDKEIATVRSLSSKPIVITDSGELSTWTAAYRRADIFGSTMYRVVWSPILGNFTYPIPAAFFRLKLAATEIMYGKKPTIVVELQAEPWQHKMLYETEVADQLKIMNPGVFRDTLEYASHTGFDTFYLWGVEWWYWLKTKHNMPEMWNTAKAAIQFTQINR